MKLSIVIICWNDLKVILECLRSIYAETTGFEFEVIISDNGSKDDSLLQIRQHFPKAIVVENGANLGFAKGNNAGIQVARGEYVLILNPDTIILNRALNQLIEFADQHPQAGGFGCRVLNVDGSFQNPARPLPTIRGYLTAALYLRWLRHFSKAFESDTYLGWDGRSERAIGYQSGCCILFRGSILQQLQGFDGRFFYHFEETDLCCRLWKSGSSIVYCPTAEITHLGGQSVGRFPIRFELERLRSRYRYFHKHFGRRGLIRIRRVTLLHYWTRRIGYGIKAWFKPSEALKGRMEMYKVVIRWNWELNVERFIATGEEPDLGYQPLAPAPQNLSEYVPEPARAPLGSS